MSDGLDFTLRANTQQFLSGLAAAAHALSQFGQQATAAMKGLGDRAAIAGKATADAAQKVSAFHKGMRDAGDEARRSLDGLTGKVTGLTSALAGLGAVVSVGALAKGAIQAASSFEQLQLSIASVVSATNSITDATGKTVTGTEKLNAALAVTASTVRKLQTDALLTTATTQELTRAFQLAVGPASAVGFTLDQTEKTVVRIVQAAGALGQPLNQVGQEIRALLTGDIDVNARIAQSLSITRPMIEQWKDQGTLFENLTKKFEEFNVSGQRAGRTFIGLVSSLRDVGQQLLQIAGTAAIKVIEDQFGRLLDTLFVAKNGIGELNPAVVRFAYQAGQAFATVITWVVDATRKIAAFVQWVSDNRGWLAIVAGVGLAGVALVKLLLTISGITTAVVALNQAFVAAFGVSMLGSATSLAAYIGGPLSASIAALLLPVSAVAAAVLGLAAVGAVVAASWFVVEQGANKAEEAVDALAASKGAAGGRRGTELSRLESKRQSGVTLSPGETDQLNRLANEDRLRRGLMPKTEESTFTLTPSVAVDTEAAKKKLKELADYQHDLREIGIKDAQRAAKAEVDALQDSYDAGTLSIKDFYAQKFAVEDAAHQKTMANLREEARSRANVAGLIATAAGSAGAVGGTSVPGAGADRFPVQDAALARFEQKLKAMGYKITSEGRSAAHNAAVGGVEDSFHIPGLAIDVAAKAGAQASEIIFLAQEAGFKAIDETARKAHVHIQTKTRAGSLAGALKLPEKDVTESLKDQANANEALRAADEDYRNKRASDIRRMNQQERDLQNEAETARLASLRKQGDIQLTVLESQLKQGIVTQQQYLAERLRLGDQGYRQEVANLQKQIGQLAQGNPQRARLKRELDDLVLRYSKERTEAITAEDEKRAATDRARFERDQARLAGNLKAEATQVKQQDEDNLLSLTQVRDKRLAIEDRSLDQAKQRRDRDLREAAGDTTKQEQIAITYEQAERDSNERRLGIGREYQQAIRGLTAQTNGFIIQAFTDLNTAVTDAAKALGKAFLDGLNDGISVVAGPAIDALRQTIFGGIQAIGKDVGGAFATFVTGLTAVGAAAAGAVFGIGLLAFGITDMINSMIHASDGIDSFVTDFRDANGEFVKITWAEKFESEMGRIQSAIGGAVDSVRRSMRDLASLMTGGFLTPAEATSSARKDIEKQIGELQKNYGQQSPETGARNTPEDIAFFMGIRKQAIERATGREVSEPEIVGMKETGDTDLDHNVRQYKALLKQRGALTATKDAVAALKGELTGLDVGEAQTKINQTLQLFTGGLISEDEARKRLGGVREAVTASLVNAIDGANDPEVKAKYEETKRNIEALFSSMGLGEEKLRGLLAERAKEEFDFNQGARDEAGNRVSVERAATLQIDKLRSDFHKDEMNRAHQRAEAVRQYNQQEKDDVKQLSKLRQELADSQKDEDKKIQDILNEGIAQRAVTVTEDKQQRIEDVKKKGAEERRDLKDAIGRLEDEREVRRQNHTLALQQMDDEEAKATLAHTNAVSRIEIETRERVNQHNVAMFQYDRQIEAEVRLNQVTQQRLEALRQSAAVMAGYNSGTIGLGGSQTLTGTAGYAGSSNYAGLGSSGAYYTFHDGGRIIRAHDGMRIGLAGDEVPIIAQTGEEVASRRQVTSIDRMIGIMQRLANPMLLAPAGASGGGINLTVDMRGISVTNGKNIDLADMPRLFSRELARSLDQSYQGMVRLPTR